MFNIMFNDINCIDAPIGEVFLYENLLLKAVKGTGCKNCDLCDSPVSCTKLCCKKKSREDKTNVVFKDISYLDYPIGTIIHSNGRILKVVEAKTIFHCEGCFFNNFRCTDKSDTPCSGSIRKDGKNIIFKDITDMESNIEDNKLVIDIPEGMEIDLDNSNLKEGIVKFKSKVLSYTEVVKNLEAKDKINWINSTVAFSYDAKLRAVVKLLNVAEYVNDGWKPNWVDANNKWFFRIVNGELKIDCYTSISPSVVAFRSREAAKLALEILGEECIKNTLK